MTVPNQLQFRLLPPEAQNAALHRLALRGCDPVSISAQTGVPESAVRRRLADAELAPLPGLLQRRRHIAATPDAPFIGLSS